MKRTFISACLAVFIILPFGASAATLSKNPFSVIDQTVSIYASSGENFDTLSSYSSVCFNDTNHCFLSTSFSSSSVKWLWTSTKITIPIPSDLNPIGDIIVYNQGSRQVCYGGDYCYSETYAQEKARISYQIQPVIVSVSPLVPKQNEQVVINGYGFGPTSGQVLFDDSGASVINWSDRSITVIASQGVGVAKKIKVSSSAGTSTTFGLFEYLDQISAPQAWQTVGTAPVVVAVIDDGVYINHPDLSPYIWRNPGEVVGNGIDDDHNGYIDDVLGYNFVDNSSRVDPKGSHGTLVASTVLATTGRGVMGNASKMNIRIMPVIVSDVQGNSSFQSLAAGIRYAADNGADVINISLGSRGTIGYTDSLTPAIQYAFDHGKVVVVAGGNGDLQANNGENLNFTPQSPVCNNNGSQLALGVGALDNTDVQTNGRVRTGWSNHGSNCINISAPGVGIVGASVPSFNSGSFYSQEDGTSYSSPIVAGVAAMVKGTTPKMKNWEIMNRVIGTADNIDNVNLGFAGQIGGRVNAYKAIGNQSTSGSIVSVSPNEAFAGTPVVVTIKNFSSDYTLRISGQGTPGGSTTDSPISWSSIAPLAADKFSVVIPASLPTGTYSFRLVSPTGNEYGTGENSLHVTNDGRSVPKNPSPEQSIPTTPSSQVTAPTQGTPVVTPSTKSLLARLLGYIVLQVQQHGEAWYIHPDTGLRYYMQDGSVAYQMMRSFGLGITDTDLGKIPTVGSEQAMKDSTSVCNANSTANKLKGKILLQVQQHGEAWYVHPDKCRRIYMKDGGVAYQIMRFLSLGITNTDLTKIPEGSL
ncbi:MAG: S8 family serine peptidase [Patescibacteria group bacterium]